MISKNDLLLIALSSNKEHPYTPVQIQKLMFLIDKNLSGQLGCSFFEFKPYDYGPFDSSIYELLEQLVRQNFVTCDLTSRGWKRHTITPEGLDRANKISSDLKDSHKKYIDEVGNFVTKLSFADLVSAIYKAYPEMKANSVFRGI